MPDRYLCNARIQGWLADDLDRVADQTASSKVQVNSAAVWWFCLRLPAEERARILGEFVTAQAMRGGTEPPRDHQPSHDHQPTAPPAAPARRRRKPKAD
jgi:hypothetical protein